MRQRLCSPFFLASLTLSILGSTSACDLESGDPSAGDPSASFRSLDVNIELAQADGGEEDGTILWEIVELEVFEGLAVAGALNLFIVDDVIHTSDGVPTCVIDAPVLDTTAREVIATNGSEVLFTVAGPYVFEGAVDVSIRNPAKLRKIFASQLLFEFDGDEVFLGERRDQFRLLHASADVESASDGRKLLIAALITGECGAGGMPGYTF